VSRLRRSEHRPALRALRIAASPFLPGEEKVLRWDWSEVRFLDVEEDMFQPPLAGLFRPSMPTRRLMRCVPGSPQWLLRSFISIERDFLTV
jgi:hypothetical protein